ncbi:MAG: hypothetical protein QXW40_07775 [Thermofilum sp.]
MRSEAARAVEQELEGGVMGEVEEVRWAIERLFHPFHALYAIALAAAVRAEAAIMLSELREAADTLAKLIGEEGVALRAASIYLSAFTLWVSLIDLAKGDAEERLEAARKAYLFFQAMRSPREKVRKVVTGLFEMGAAAERQLQLLKLEVGFPYLLPEELRKRVVGRQLSILLGGPVGRPQVRLAVEEGARMIAAALAMPTDQFLTTLFRVKLKRKGIHAMIDELINSLLKICRNSGAG